MSRGLTRLVVVWPWVLALLVCAPLLAPGYVLTYDMVWVPDLALRPDTVGLGTALPRAVPSDAVVAVLDEVVPGQVLQKAMLVGVLGVAGAGMARLWDPTMPVAALASSTLYVWNPFVAERFLIGHWPLLISYAALPWVVAAARRLPTGEPAAWGSVLLALLTASFSPTGGIAAVAVALAVAAGHDARNWRRLALTAAAGVGVNAPWIIAGLAHPQGAASDPRGVELFASSAEGVLGLPLTVLTLGGIWNGSVVPGSREGALAALGVVVVLAVAGGGVLRARDTQAGMARLTWLGLGGVALAMAGALAPAVLETVVVGVPGGGLLRDGSRFLLLWALPLAMAFGAGVQALLRQWPRRAVTAFTGVLAVMWPVVTMPDLAWGLGGTVQPAAYPQAWRDVTDAVDSRAAAGDVLVLPFRAYRAPSWNDGHPVLDPAGRLFEVTTVVDDALVVAGTTVRGEDPRAAAVRTALSGTDPAAGLADLGIATVVFASEAGDAGIDLEEFPVVQTSSTVEVRAVPGQIADPAEPARSRLVAVALAWAAAGCLLVAGVVLAVLGRRRSNAAVCPTAR